jgi:tetratricopeptide (TPR) repeat protein
MRNLALMIGQAETPAPPKPSRMSAQRWGRRFRLPEGLIYLILAAPLAAAAPDMEAARDRQDRAALEKHASDSAAAAEKAPKDADAQYRAALAASYVAEVALEVRDKQKAQQTAESGIKAAERAIAIKPSAEYYRLLGTLYGQAAAGGNMLAIVSYGKKARDAVSKALDMDPRSARNWLARGIGNYYMAALGGNQDPAIADMKKAIEIDPKLADAWLWLGVSLRKAKRNAEARQAFQKSLELNPRRVWAKEQLDKTPAA